MRNKPKRTIALLCMSRKIILFSGSIIIFVAILLAFFDYGYCQRVQSLTKEEEAIIEKVKNYVTSSGKTISQIIEESVTKEPTITREGAVILYEPAWYINKAPQDMPGYIIGCWLGATFYFGSEGRHAHGRVEHHWYYDGKTIYAVQAYDYQPNEIDEEILEIDKKMPVWKIDLEAIIKKVKDYVTSSGSSIGQIIDGAEGRSITDKDTINTIIDKIIRKNTDKERIITRVIYGKPRWTAEWRFGWGGYYIRCDQGAIIYLDNGERIEIPYLRSPQWFHDGKNLYAIDAKEIDKEMPVWKFVIAQP